MNQPTQSINLDFTCLGCQHDLEAEHQPQEQPTENPLLIPSEQFWMEEAIS